MKTCLTKPLAGGLSGCLVDKPECEHAVRVGFSLWCKHREHTTFHGHTAHDLSREELAKRYTRLRQQRVEEFLAGMDEATRERLADHEAWRQELAMLMCGDMRESCASAANGDTNLMKG